MTKTELRHSLEEGRMLIDLFTFKPGQDCFIYKANDFCPGQDIIYIPDIFLNELPFAKCVTSADDIEDIIACCFTGDDFIEETSGDVELARQLFCYVDWQHPSSALPEIEEEDL